MKAANRFWPVTPAVAFLLFQFCCSGFAQPAAIHLQGAPNFRDIGGLQTADGHRVKSGLLFRSGQLSSLTAADYEMLWPLKIRFVFDLRTDGERGAAPTNWPGTEAPELISAPMGFGVVPGQLPPAEMMRTLAEKLHSEDDARGMMTTGMRDLPETGRGQIRTILVRLSEGAEPAIVHCTAGKDRTGLVVAVLLTILGVPHEQVLEDYLASNAAMNAKAALPPGLKLPFDPSILRPMMSVEPGYLEASFRQIEEKYGSFEAYRRNGLGLADEQVQRLKALFLR